ncbi:MAG: hypothetical protein QOI78_3921, partial [Actinomycetota bacterium]|nr:hypothetical protein [Actinomycetota bacterium]
MSVADMNRLVTKLFCDSTSRYGGFRVPGGGEAQGVELLDDTLYRYNLEDAASLTPMTVQFYTDVTGLGEGLWKQELRVLRRVAALRHPALPEVVRGGHIDEAMTEDFGIHGCAFVVTRSGTSQLYDDSDTEYGMRAGLVGVVEYLQKHRQIAVAHFMALADALSLLHDLGVVHRNIWPGTIARTAGDDGGDQLMLSRFEMSSLLSNLLRSSLLDANERAEQARQLILTQGGDALAYFSPERIRFLLVKGARLEDHRSDIYGLGTMVAEWLTGPIPEELLAAVNTALETGPDLDALLAAARRINQHLIGALRVLPNPLATLLSDMLAWDKPTARPSATDVVGRLSDHYERLTAENDDSTGAPYLLVFIPGECRE